MAPKPIKGKVFWRKVKKEENLFLIRSNQELLVNSTCNPQWGWMKTWCVLSLNGHFKKRERRKKSSTDLFGNAFGNWHKHASLSWGQALALHGTPRICSFNGWSWSLFFWVCMSGFSGAEDERDGVWGRQLLKKVPLLLASPTYQPNGLR